MLPDVSQIKILLMTFLPNVVVLNHCGFPSSLKFAAGKIGLGKVGLQSMKSVRAHFSKVLTTAKADLGEKKGQFE